MACNKFFVVAITPYRNFFVFIATIFFIVIDRFSYGVMCLNHVKFRHVNLWKKYIEHTTEYKIMLL